EVLPPASERLRGHPRGLLQPISAKEGEGQFDRDEEGVQEDEEQDGGGPGGPMEREDGIPEEKRATEDEGEDRQAGGDGPRHREPQPSAAEVSRPRLSIGIEAPPVDDHRSLPEFRVGPRLHQDASRNAFNGRASDSEKLAVRVRRRSTRLAPTPRASPRSTASVRMYVPDSQRTRKRTSRPSTSRGSSS